MTRRENFFLVEFVLAISVVPGEMAARATP